MFGNGETYNLHLRTADTGMVWQSYRASFPALPQWQTLRLPLADFQPHRITTPLDVRRLKRIGVVAIGRAFAADVCIGRVALYGSPRSSARATGHANMKQLTTQYGTTQTIWRIERCRELQARNLEIAGQKNNSHALV